MPGTDLIKSTLHKKNRVFPSIGGVSAAVADDGVVTAQIITLPFLLRKKRRGLIENTSRKLFGPAFGTA